MNVDAVIRFEDATRHRFRRRVSRGGIDFGTILHHRGLDGLIWQNRTTDSSLPHDRAKRFVISYSYMYASFPGVIEVPVLRPGMAEKAGLSRSALYRAAREGRLERIARGVYIPADAGAVDWDWIEAATRRPEATICLTSSLAHHQLTDAIPAALDVAIPRGSRKPASNGAIAWHQFDRATFEIGRGEILIPGTDQTIGMYSPERSIADAFRLRGEVGYELARESLKEWLRRGGKAARLMEIASRLPRTKSPVLHALEILT